MSFSSADLTKIVDYYFDIFTQPLLRKANQTVLEAHIDVAASIIKEHLNIDVTENANYEFSDRLHKETFLIDVENKPLISIDESSLVHEEESLDIDDHPYKLHLNSIEFYDGIAAGDFSFTYTAGKSVGDNDDLKHAVCLMVNHLIEIKMLDAEKVGIITSKPDRNLIPQEVKNILGSSDLQIGVI